MSDPPTRVNFFDGLLLSAGDLAVEQQYHRRMRYLHNQLHGYGTVWGLEVAVTDGDVVVGTGMAIDVHGREIVVTEPLSLALDGAWAAGPTVGDLVIAWYETADHPVPGPNGTIAFARWVEQPQLAVVAADEAADEGGDEVLLLARLTWTDDHSVDVDPSVRRPFGPAQPST